MLANYPCLSCSNPSLLFETPVEEVMPLRIMLAYSGPVNGINISDDISGQLCVPLTRCSSLTSWAGWQHSVLIWIRVMHRYILYLIQSQALWKKLLTVWLAVLLRHRQVLSVCHTALALHEEHRVTLYVKSCSTCTDQHWWGIHMSSP